MDPNRKVLLGTMSKLLHILGVYYRMGDKKDGNYGRAEVTVDGQWGSLCSSYFGVNDAKVFCKALVNYVLIEYLLLILISHQLTYFRCLLSTG